jgi:hypothetical protein
MKDLVLLILQIVVIACLLGFIFSLLNYFLGWNIGFRGAAVPADLRATTAFLVVGGACAAIVYFWDRRPKSQKSPD